MSGEHDKPAGAGDPAAAAATTAGNAPAGGGDGSAPLSAPVDGIDSMAKSQFDKPHIAVEKYKDFAKDGFEIKDGYRVYGPQSPYPFDDKKPYFAIDTYAVEHAAYRGGSKLIVREVFERRDAVGVVLFNRENKTVVVVEQFRLATVDRLQNPGTRKGWIVETIAGEVKDERPEATAIRETKEESGYEIRNPELIAEFMSSPGGASEKIYLYFAEVVNADKKGPGGGTQSEDIKPVEMPLEEFRQKLRKRELIDPKLIIAGYYLQARLGIEIEIDDVLDASHDRPKYVFSKSETKSNPQAKDTPQAKKDPKTKSISIGFKTGDVLSVRDVDIWLNPENRYLMMSRIIDRGLSASIRWGGARKYANNTVAQDTIGNALRVSLGERSETDENEIIETDPGELRNLGVRRLLHLPIAEAPRRSNGIAFREGVWVSEDKVSGSLKAALLFADERETGLYRLRNLFRWKWRQSTSVLVPLLGAGEGKLTPQQSINGILNGIDDFLAERPDTTLVNFFILAYWKRDFEVAEAAIKARAQLKASKYEQQGSPVAGSTQPSPDRGTSAGAAAPTGARAAGGASLAAASG